jgi:hypothetical protein
VKLYRLWICCQLQPTQVVTSSLRTPSFLYLETSRAPTPHINLCGVHRVNRSPRESETYFFISAICNRDLTAESRPENFHRRPRHIGCRDG